MNSTLSPEQTKIATDLLKVMVVPNDNLIEELDKFNTKYKYQAMDNNIVDLFNKLTLKAQGLKLMQKILDMQVVDTSVQSEITIDLNILTKIPNDKLENELNLIELKWDNVPFSKDNKIILDRLRHNVFIFNYVSDVKSVLKQKNENNEINEINEIIVINEINEIESSYEII